MQEMENIANEPIETAASVEPVESENGSSGYQGYNALVTKTTQSLAAMEEICEEMQMEERTAQLKKMQERMNSRMFSVGIMGEFRRGKSTVINALLGAEIVPSDVVPTSAVLNYIRWDAKTRAEIHFKDGTQKEIPVDQLTNYVTKTTQENADMAATVEDATVYYPCRFCQNGVQIIDTPGLNDDDRMNAIAQKVIPSLDAVVVVMSAEIPVSQSEAQFLREKIMLSDMGRVLFVVNKIDYIRKKDRPKLLAEFRKRINDSVLKKIEMVYGADSKEYRSAAEKAGEIQIFPISARDALDGRLEGDEQLLKESGILDFEEALSKMLTQERGMLELASPVNAIESAAKEVRTAITARMNTLNMNQQELDAACEKGLQEAARAREKVKIQITDLKRKASGLYQELLPDVQSVYKSMEEELLVYADGLEIPSEDLKNEKTRNACAETISADMSALLNEKMNDAAQVLLVKIQERIGEEMVQLEDAGREILSGVVSAQQTLTGQTNENTLETVTSGIFGIGAMVKGWKENGLPGALVGGGVGVATTIGSGIALCTAVTILGAGMLPALPFFLIGGVVGNIAGKTAVEKLFNNPAKREKKLRGMLREYVEESMRSLKSARSLENWLESATSDIYENISAMMDEEVEATLVGFEKNIAQLKLDHQKKAGELDALKEELNHLLEKLDKLKEQMQPVREKLKTALTPAVKEGEEI